MTFKHALVASTIILFGWGHGLQAQTSTSTTLTATPNPATFGSVVTIGATVTPNSTTGTVTFYDGTYVLGKAALTAGVAQITTVMLPAGVQSLTARYNGGVGFLASISPAVPVTVTAVSSGSLATIAQMNAGTNPSAIASADFNHDGRPDLVVANQLSNNVSVFIASGPGTFQAPVLLPATRPTAIATGDFNGDGKIDFAVVESSSSDVRIFLGNGDGSFVVGSPFPVGTLPLGIVAADFNKDGNVDLATSNLGNNDISVLLSNGDGTFQTALSTSVAGYLNFLSAGDFNGDGKPDIAIAVYDQDAVDVFIGNGDGTFQPNAAYTVGASPYAVAIGDFNGDGKLDLAVTNGGAQSSQSTVSILLGTGSGTFQPATSVAGVFGAQAITTGDFNGDGKLDLAVANTANNTIGVITGTGAGTFNAPISFGAGSFPSGLVVADFNGDGKTDVAVSDLNAPSGAANVNVLAGGAAVLALVQGNGQVAATGAPFATPLEVKVTGFGSALAGVPVTFTAPSSGASGTFTGGATTATVNTDVNGNATAPTFTANGVVGTYSVVATSSAGSVSFTLTNSSSNCTISFVPTSTTVDSTGGTIAVAVTASSPSCSYGVTSNVPWVTTSGSSGVGSGTVTLTVAAYTSGTADRSGTVSIGGLSFTVNQSFTSQQFADVLPSAYYFDAVNLLKAHNITAGCSATDYCPTSEVTRDQMAIFIVRTVYNGDDNFTYSQTPYFTDVTPTTFAFKWIQKLYELGITAGCAPSLYCPTDPVARDQMAIFIIRARYGSTTAFTYSSTPLFTDVLTTEFAFNWIQRLKQDNITSGCSATTYCPSNTVTRGDMAIFIMRGGFNQLLPPTQPIISAISPTTIVAGGSATYTVTGVNTNFVQGVTTVVPVGGITASNLTVLSPTQFTVTLTASPTAPIQPESIYVQTEPEEAVLPNGINVIPTP